MTKLISGDITGFGLKRCVLALGVACVASLALAEATLADRPAGMDGAYAYASCAPWDGPALEIVLQHGAVSKQAKDLPKPRYPNYSVSVWIDKPPIGSWITYPKLGDSHTGSLRWCATENQCSTLEGRLKITRLDKNTIEGELRRPLADGREAKIPFKGPLLPSRMMCG